LSLGEKPSGSEASAPFEQALICVNMPLHATNSLAEQLWTLLVGSILVVWFIASAIHQFRFPWWSRISRFDALNLLPRWSFFAPNPGRHDFHVVYRDWVDDQPGPWMQLAATNVDTRWRWLWNPSRYTNKAISDLANGLYQARQLSAEEPWTVMLSSSYISLLHMVMAQPPTTLETYRRQFAIVRTHGFGTGRQLEIAFASEVHRASA
jgi:hypothetical protein